MSLCEPLIVPWLYIVLSSGRTLWVRAGHAAEVARKISAVAEIEDTKVFMPLCHMRRPAAFSDLDGAGLFFSLDKLPFATPSNIGHFVDCLGDCLFEMFDHEEAACDFALAWASLSVYLGRLLYAPRDHVPAIKAIPRGIEDLRLWYRDFTRSLGAGDLVYTRIPSACVDLRKLFTLQKGYRIWWPLLSDTEYMEEGWYLDEDASILDSYL